MRARPKLDANQPAIVKALRDAGHSVQSLAAIGKGCPDICVGYRDKDDMPRNILMEIKDPNSPSKARRNLTPDEFDWHAAWKGQVTTVFSIEEALGAIGALKR